MTDDKMNKEQQPVTRRRTREERQRREEELAAKAEDRSRRYAEWYAKQPAAWRMMVESNRTESDPLTARDRAKLDQKYGIVYPDSL